MLSAGRSELICDLAETYHVLDMWALPVPLLATLASGLRDHSRIKMKMAGLRYIPLEFVLPQIRDHLVQIFAEKGKKPELLTDLMLRKEKKREKNRAFGSGSEFTRTWNRMLRGVNHG